MATSVDLARRLLRLAKDDEHAARAMLSAGSITDAIVGLHAQQAVEKALKAALTINEVEFPFSHDLELLIQLCEKSGMVMDSALDGVGDLTPFAGIERYGSEEPRTPLDRDQALRWAAAAVEWARQQIEPTRAA